MIAYEIAEQEKRNINESLRFISELSLSFREIVHYLRGKKQIR